MAGEIGSAAGDPDAVTALGEAPDDMPAEEAGPANKGDQCIGRIRCHAVKSIMLTGFGLLPARGRLCKAEIALHNALS